MDLGGDVWAEVAGVAVDGTAARVPVRQRKRIISGLHRPLVGAATAESGPLLVCVWRAPPVSASITAYHQPEL